MRKICYEHFFFLILNRTHVYQVFIAGDLINQTDYILVMKRFRSGVKTARTRTVTGADVGSDHDFDDDDDFSDTP